MILYLSISSLDGFGLKSCSSNSGFLEPQVFSQHFPKFHHGISFLLVDNNSNKIILTSISFNSGLL